MEKGYYSIVTKAVKCFIYVAIHNKNGKGLLLIWLYCRLLRQASQSTIKMEKGYYNYTVSYKKTNPIVSIHNKNGKGLLPYLCTIKNTYFLTSLNPQ